MTRKTNNELSLLPGFFFHPQQDDGLVKLSFEDRCLLLENQGNYMVPLWVRDPNMRTDLECSLENSRIPTHRQPDAAIPGYGDVPFDLREVKAV